MTTPRFERILGQHIGDRAGPTVVVCGGLHGNEPAGALAAQRVSAALDNLSLPLRGEWLAIAGNLAALRQERRFLANDLNRCWTEPEVRAMLMRDPAEDNAEQAEQRELVAILGDAAKRARGPLVLFDLHTTSGESPPFLVISDTLANRTIARRLPGTIILGLEESIDGTLLDYMSQIGHRGMVIESGQHSANDAVSIHESYIWAGLAAARQLDAADVPGRADHRRRLRAARNGSPRIVDVRYQHALQPEDCFTMEPGFKTFQHVEQNDVLAQDRDGPVRAPLSGMVLMPLYQDQGSDGFFLVRPVHRFWLPVSRVLRRLRLGGLLPILPGVKRDPDRPDALRVDAKVARWYTVEIFHLFGYRRRRREGDSYLFTRRS